MIIRTKINNFILLLVSYILCLAMAILFGMIGGIFPALVLFWSISILYISYLITIGRIITMTDFGCKIKFWKYTREYAWDAITLKRQEPPHLGLRLPYHHGGVFFSIRPSRKPAWLDPTLYCMFCHPVSCFYVYFSPNGVKQDQSTTPGIYEVGKNEFLCQLKTWGIEIE